MKILNFGSLNYDMVYQVEHIVTAGETLMTGSMERFCGGKGLNQSVALARAGMEVWHAGAVGEDGDQLLLLCEECRIHTDYIRLLPFKTGHTIIQVDQTAQNCILLYGGSNLAITREQVDEVLSHFSQGDVLVLQNEVSELDYIIRCGAEKGMTIFLNPSPYNEKMESCDLSKVSVFLMNENEGACMTRREEPDEILEEMAKKYPGAAVVLTLGQDGSVCFNGDQRVRQGIYSVHAVDTTAAGDTYTGYFIAGMARGLDLQRTMELSACAAGIAVSRHGAVPSIPGMDEVLAILERTIRV